MPGKYSDSLEISGNACDQVYEKKGKKREIKTIWRVNGRYKIVGTLPTVNRDISETFEVVSFPWGEDDFPAFA